MQPLSQPLDTIRAHYDVIVIGSGYGGGVAASRLARCGQSVCVLERGKEFRPGDFPDRFPEIRRELQVRGKSLDMGRDDGLFDFRLGSDIHVFVGCGLGGGSLINAGVALQPDPRVFEDEGWPREIARDGLLEEGFRRARSMLRPAAHPDARSLTKYKALERASRPFAAEPQPAEVTVGFADTVNPAGVDQPACTLCGDCCTGCNVGAKNSVDLTYLADARRHGAELFTSVRAEHLERDGERWRIRYTPVGAGSDDGRDAQHAVTAAVVVLAAGTLGSTEILMRSREHGLAVSDRLGERFSANGDIIAFGYGADERVNAIGVGHPPKVELDPVGPCVAGQTRLNQDDALERGLYLQEGVMPSGLAALLPVAFMPNGRLLGAASSIISGVYKGPFSRLHSFFIVSHDAAAGRLTITDGRLTVDWPDVAEQPVYKRVDAVLEQAAQATGAKYIRNPLAGTVMGKQPLTAHPLGGCGMGHDRVSGVVNHKCQVFDAGSGADADSVHPGLYVCDGAVMPRALGVNPLLSITAITERAMMLLARDRNWRFDDALLQHAEAASGHADAGV